ncbi:hypothetical protein M231_01223 [Tremella mesenterica]|uniref:HIT-type domain-containing protein n=2 Tax=Tremella mesenterica TaxID=5217 RepID=A0A4Q1BTZ1_TREME|nr:hypothetical protein M231_01223 [Tremella mesenterica]
MTLPNISSLPQRPISLPLRPSTTSSSPLSRPLPVKPSSFLPSIPSALPLPTTDPTPNTFPATCVICSLQSKYTCPGCSRKSCSAECSKSHKSLFSCTGQRNPITYKPLNSYTQGDWAEDYVWLEQGRRKVAEWGEEVSTSMESAARGRGGVRGGGRGGRGGRSGRKKNVKLNGLQRQLEERGCIVKFVSDGMERRKMNQSSWNPKTRNLFITIELLHSDKTGKPIKTFHPRVLFDTSQGELRTLSSLFPSHLSSENTICVLPYIPIFSPFPASSKFDATRTSDGSFSNPLIPLTSPSTNSPNPPLSSLYTSSTILSSSSVPTSSSVPLSTLTSHPTSSNPKLPSRLDQTTIPSPPKMFYPPLDVTIPLRDSLKGTEWLEYPSIHLFDKMDWEEKLKQGEVVIIPVHVEKREKGDSSRGIKRARSEDDVGGKGDIMRDGGWKNRKVELAGVLGYDSPDGDTDGEGEGEGENDEGDND